jgi:hypothetical protein
MGNWSCVAAVTVAFVYTLATAPTIVLVLPTVSQAGQTSQAQLQANDPRTPTSSLQWRGCLICRCRPDMGLVDCTGKIMSDGRLPDVESFPTNTSTYNFGDCGVNHVDYDYFLAFPTIAVIRGDNNHIREPFLVPPTTSLLYLSNNSLTTTSDFFNTSFSYNNLQEVDLSYNSISVLHSGAFKGLNHLKSLYANFLKIKNFSL